MISNQTENTLDKQQLVPQAIIQALFQRPETLQQILEEAGLAPYELAMWARQVGDKPEIEKLAGWLSVGQQPGEYKPLLEAAASHLRAGDLLEALPVFGWAYRTWLAADQDNQAGGSAHADEKRQADGLKLLALWGECLYALDQAEEALKRWLRSLDMIDDAPALTQLARMIEQTGAEEAYLAVLHEAQRRNMPGAASLGERWQRLQSARQPQAHHPAVHGAVTPPSAALGSPLPLSPACLQAPCPQARHPTPTAVMADVANLDQVCGEQFGYDRQLDYGLLLQAAGQHGPLQVKMAFVPDIPATLTLRPRLLQAGFQLDLQRPKRSHGRVAANADTAMAAFAVRWAADPAVERLELWSGDGDFLKVREAVNAAWPHVQVVFRSFEVGTAAAIRQLGEDWQPIGAQFVSFRYPK